MKTVYLLEKNAADIASMQRASLDAGSIGLRITHGLIGSDEWWSKIRSGELALHSAQGTVSGFWSGLSGAGPAEFELQTNDGQRTMWLCEMEPNEAKKEFYIGRNVDVEFVIQELKSALEGGSNEAYITISIALL